MKTLNTIVLSISIVSAFALSHPVRAQDFETGYNLYLKGQYREAAAKFEQLIQVKPTARHILFCAFAQANSKNTARAKQLFEHLQKGYPGSREAQQAAQALATISGGASAATSAGAQQTHGTSGGHASAAVAATGHSVANFASRDMTGLVKVMKATAERPEVTSSFADDVSTQLKGIPLQLVHLFREKGLKMCITPTAIDYDPRLERTQPRGYENGKTFRNVPAFYNPGTRELVIAEYAYSGSNLSKTDDPLGSMWHEMGHAVDHVMGNLSSTPEYRRIYENCVKNMDESNSSRLSYYLQSGDTGPSETFAEMFSYIYGGRNTYHRQVTAETLYDTFAEVASFIKRKVSELR